MNANARIALGIALAVGGNVLFFTSAWIAWMPWPAGVKAALWGTLFFAPEAGTLLGIAIMGRENFDRFKAVLVRWLLRIKPAGNIGLWRHRIGLVMICVPLIPTYIQAYHPAWLPDHTIWRWISRIVADGIFIGGLFVLGGDFWDKLYALFSRSPAVRKDEEKEL